MFLKWSISHKARDKGRLYLNALVISLGVDPYEKDPISRFKLKKEHFCELGDVIAKAVQCPTLIVMEGGYAVEDVGINVVNVLTGFLNA